MRYSLILITIFILTLTSCDCYYQLSGVVMDINTRSPISNVAIGKTDTTDLDNPFNRKSYTDNNGEYNISGVGGSCKKITMYFSATNYLTEKRTFRNGTSDTIYLEPKNVIVINQNSQFIYENDTTITVEWLGLSCFCPNWIEIQYLKELQNDTIGEVKDEFSISITPSQTSNDLYQDNKFGIQTPLVYKLKGRFFIKKIEHKAKGMTYESRTFEYDSYEMIEY